MWSWIANGQWEYREKENKRGTYFSIVGICSNQNEE